MILSTLLTIITIYTRPAAPVTARQSQPRPARTASVNSVQNLCGSYTANDWVNDLIGGIPASLITVLNPSYTGACNASGLATFNDSINYIGYSSEGIGTTALVLTTGNLDTVIRSANLETETSGNNGELGDADLDVLLGIGNTFDASVIEFDIVSAIDSGLSFEYVFASDEYNEYVGSEFNDIFAFWMNDVDIAKIGSTFVSINNINQNSLSQYFVNNEAGLYATEYDGLTVRLRTSIFQATANQVVHVKLAIADVADYSLDSAVFIKPQSFLIHTSTPAPITAVPTSVTATPTAVPLVIGSDSDSSSGDSGSSSGDSSSDEGYFTGFLSDNEIGNGNFYGHEIGNEWTVHPLNIFLLIVWSVIGFVILNVLAYIGYIECVKRN